MPVEWDQFEAVDAPKSDVPWGDFEAVEPPVKRNKLGESKEDLAWQMQNARMEGKLGNFTTDAITGLQNTAEVLRNPIGAFARTTAPVFNKLAGETVASEFKGIPTEGILDDPIQMTEDALNLPRGYFKDEQNPVKGVTDSLEQTAGGLTKPESLVVMPLFGPEAGVVAPAASTVGKVLLGGEMAHGTTEAARNFGNVMADPDATTADKFNAFTGAGTAFAMTGATAGHALPKGSDVPIPDFSGRDLPIPEGFRVPEPPPAPKAPRAAVPETPAEPQKGMTVLEEIRNAGAKTKEDIRKLYPQLTREQAAQLRNQAWGEPAAPIVPPEAPAAPAIEPKPVAPVPPATPEAKPFEQAPEPEKFDSLDDLLAFRNKRIQEEKDLYQREIGLTPEEADKLQNLHANDRDTIRFEKGLDPEKLKAYNRFFDESPYNKVGGPFEFWDHDRNFNPEELTGETDKNFLATTLISAVQKGLTQAANNDRFIYAAIAAKKLKSLGATKSDVARALDKYTTRNSGSQGDKAEFFKSLGTKVNDFLSSQGADLDLGDLGKGNAPATNDRLITEAKQGKFAVTPEAESLIQEILGQPSRDSREVETKSPEPAISAKIAQEIPPEASEDLQSQLDAEMGDSNAAEPTAKFERDPESGLPIYSESDLAKLAEIRQRLSAETNPVKKALIASEINKVKDNYEGESAAQDYKPEVMTPEEFQKTGAEVLTNQQTGSKPTIAFKLDDGTILFSKKWGAHIDALDLPKRISDRIVDGGFVTDGKWESGGDLSKGIKPGETVSKYYGNESEPTAPEKPKRRDSIFDRETDIVGPDILSWINENGLMLSKSAARKLWGKEKFTKNKSQWDDATTMQKPHHGMAIYGNKFASSPNQIADTAFKAGKISEPSVNKLWEAIDAASRKRAGAFKGQERENTALATEITEQDNWEKATKEGSKEVNSDDLGLGDTLKLGEHEVKVTHIDPDSGDVTVDGGKQFGTKVIPQGETIKVDKITTKPFGEDFTPEPTAEPSVPENIKPGDKVSFMPSAKRGVKVEGTVQDIVNGGRGLNIHSPLPGDPTRVVRVWAEDGKFESLNEPEAPKLRPGEKGTGDLLQGEDAPFNLSGETEVDASRVAAEKAKAEQAKREAAELVKKQQPGLFDSPAISKAEQWANDKLKGGGTSSGPDVLAAYAVKGAITIARGVKDFGEWSASMLKELGEAVRPHLQDIWERVKGQESPESEAERVSKMSADEFNKFTPPGTATKAGYELAKRLGADGDKTKLAEYEKATVAEMAAAMKKAMSAAKEDRDKIMNDGFVLGVKKQYFNEAQRMMTALGDVERGMSFEDAGRKNGLQASELEKYAAKPGSAGLAKNVRNVSGATGEGGFVKIPSLKEITDKILGGDTKEKLDAFSRWRDNHTTPKTMAASEASGNAINRYAAAAHASPLVARSMALDVLGANAKNVKFRQKLGAVLVEDRLRAIKEGFLQAAKAAKTQAEKGKLLTQASEVNTLVGSGKSFASEADFKAALKDPEIRASIAKHKATIQANATKFHTETGGNLAGPGVNTGAFVNLEALHEDRPEMVFGKGGTKGDYSQPFKKKSVFNRQAAGTGKNYELDYNRLAERMIRGNFQEYAKRQMYDQLQKDNLAKILPPNAPGPEIGGKPSTKFQIVRQGNQTENLWVRKDIASEVRQALNLDGPLSDTAIAKVASMVNKLQMSLATDAVYHMANIMSAIAGKQGGKSIWTDIARKVPGVNIIDAGIRIGAKARQVLADDPEIVKAMAEISQIGASRPEHAEAGRAGRMIALLDKSARLIRNDMYDNLVKRGIVTESEGGRREFINQVGQYNPRLMGTLSRIFKEAGISPFLVAGKTFNRAALRTTTLDPGYKAATRTAAVQGRVVEGLGVVATLVAIPALINSITTGKPNGRKGVQFGQIDTGKSDSKGNPIVVDPSQWIGLRRGLRMTGVNALINGMKAHKPGREIAKDAGTDIIGAITHPWAGPVVQAPTIFATGHNTSGYAESSDPNNYVENFKSALKSINPVVHAFFSKNEDTLTGRVANAGKSFGGAVGVKTAQAQSAQQEVQNRARSWGLSSDVPKVKTAFEQREQEKFPPSIYKPLKEAVRLEDSPKIIQSVKDLLAVEPDQKARDKRKKEILREFNPFTKAPDSYDVKIKPFATRDKVFESAFIKSLDADGKESYRQSVRDQVKAYRTLTQALYNKASDPKDTPELYRTR